MEVAPLPLQGCRWDGFFPGSSSQGQIIAFFYTRVAAVETSSQLNPLPTLLGAREMMPPTSSLLAPAAEMQTVCEMFVWVSQAVLT